MARNQFQEPIDLTQGDDSPSDSSSPPPHPKFRRVLSPPMAEDRRTNVSQVPALPGVTKRHRHKEDHREAAKKQIEDHYSRRKVPVYALPRTQSPPRRPAPDSRAASYAGFLDESSDNEDSLDDEIPFERRDMRAPAGNTIKPEKQHLNVPVPFGGIESDTECEDDEIYDEEEEEGEQEEEDAYPEQRDSPVPRDDEVEETMQSVLVEEDVTVTHGLDFDEAQADQYHTEQHHHGSAGEDEYPSIHAVLDAGNNNEDPDNIIENSELERSRYVEGSPDAKHEQAVEKDDGIDSDDDEDAGTIEIDPKGDLLIVAGNRSTGVARFLVKSSRLQEHPKWKTFLEARQLQPKEQSELLEKEQAQHRTESPPPADKQSPIQQRSAAIDPVEEPTKLTTESPDEMPKAPASPKLDSATTKAVIQPLIDAANVERSIQTEIEAQHGAASTQAGDEIHSDGWFFGARFRDDLHQKLDFGEHLSITFNSLSNGERDWKVDMVPEQVRKTFPDPNWESIQDLADEGTVQPEPTNEIKSTSEIPAAELGVDTGLEIEVVPEVETEAEPLQSAEDQTLSAPAEGRRMELPKVFEPRFISMPEDHPEAVGIALHVLHSEVDELPAVVGFDVIYELAVHCEKFGTERRLTRFVREWIERFLPSALETGSVRWLYIAWVFRLQHLFDAHMQHLVCTSRTAGGELDVEELPGHGETLLNLVKESRENLLRNVLDITTKYMDRNFWNRNYNCRVSSSKHDCAAHVYVAFAVKLMENELWPTSPSPANIHISPSALRQKVFDINVVGYTSAHADCADLVDRFKEDVLFEVRYTAPSERYNRHFKQDDTLGQASLRSLMGSYLFGLGFTSADIGYTSVVKCAKRRRGANMLDESTQRECAMADHLFDDEDTDFEVDDEPELFVDEEFFGVAQLELSYDELMAEHDGLQRDVRRIKVDLSKYGRTRSETDRISTESRPRKKPKVSHVQLTPITQLGQRTNHPQGQRKGKAANIQVWHAENKENVGSSW
ncbi:hypothetical protein BCR34DRAFT_600756 [Clohesyomyces aquaticus]|uniref:Uncharacterized protein n=1 Tax=Clohesyomyces aquaticus TaxID=1231657 RepID=A0A1Y1ZPL2_9PLEO|nr:hypothetical protein BCR34DRAFT_600756 [Clohesyomyces aquaticus]